MAEERDEVVRIEPEPITDRVRRLAKESSDSSLAQAAQVLAYAYDEIRESIERMLNKTEVTI